MIFDYKKGISIGLRMANTDGIAPRQQGGVKLISSEQSKLFRIKGDQPKPFPDPR